MPEKCGFKLFFHQAADLAGTPYPRIQADDMIGKAIGQDTLPFFDHYRIEHNAPVAWRTDRQLTHRTLYLLARVAVTEVARATFFRVKMGGSSRPQEPRSINAQAAEQRPHPSQKPTCRLF